MSEERKLTGFHVAAIFVAAFGVIIAVNLTLAFNAVGSFPGVEVKISYVASQHFDKDREAQLSLGWSVRAEARGDEVLLYITDENGAPVEVVDLQATLGRATHVKDDQKPEFVFNGSSYTAPAELAPGNWNIRMTALAEDGTAFRQRVILHVRKGT